MEERGKTHIQILSLKLQLYLDYVTVFNESWYVHETVWYHEIIFCPC